MNELIAPGDYFAKLETIEVHQGIKGVNSIILKYRLDDGREVYDTLTSFARRYKLSISKRRCNDGAVQNFIRNVRRIKEK